jgi:hypothetical protein
MILECEYPDPGFIVYTGFRYIPQPVPKKYSGIEIKLFHLISFFNSLVGLLKS